MEQNKSSIGGIVGTIIIIALIILGGLYFWGKRIEESKAKQELVNQESQATTSDTEANVIMSTDTGDDVDSIQADLDKTNLNNLTTEINVQSK